MDDLHMDDYLAQSADVLPEYTETDRHTHTHKKKRYERQMEAL